MLACGQEINSTNSGSTTVSVQWPLQAEYLTVYNTFFPLLFSKYTSPSMSLIFSAFLLMLRFSFFVQFAGYVWYFLYTNAFSTRAFSSIITSGDHTWQCGSIYGSNIQSRGTNFRTMDSPGGPFVARTTHGVTDHVSASLSRGMIHLVFDISEHFL